MNEVYVILGIVLGVLAVIGGYTGLIYKIATVTSSINQNTALILEVRNIVVRNDEKYDELERRVLILETKGGQHEQ